jgi:nitrite reductase (cytochrome c-552)
MTKPVNPSADDQPKLLRLPLWMGIALAGVLAAAVIVLHLLVISIMERRWEAQRPVLTVSPVKPLEPDSAVWGQNYPRQYDSYLRTRMTGDITKFGGSGKRDYLEMYPVQVILFAGYAFSKGYDEPRGHAYSVEDVTTTPRLARPFQPATCWTCKSSDVPRMMEQMGTQDFYAANFHDLAGEMKHPIGCADCHDSKTMRLRISRPALAEAFAAQGRDITQATHQELRSLACAQCHAEYYFAPDPKNYLTFPWRGGTDVEAMIAYYDEIDFTDYVHPVSKTPIIKSQHPDYELYTKGIHAYRNVACADCHMPYRTEGGAKFTDHHVQSPLLNIANSCAVCHRWEEAEIRGRVEAIQTSVAQAMGAAENALVLAHFDVAAAMQAGAGQEELTSLRRTLRHAQFRWDYISSSNGMGFHAPQEAMRVLGEATNQAQQVRIAAARLLAARGVSETPSYPDFSTKEKALEIAEAFAIGEGIELIGRSD